MKRNYLNQITLLFIAVFVFAAIFVACKKDKLTEPENPQFEDESYFEDKTKSIVKRIKTFEKKLKDVKDGNLRHDVYMDVDSALWNIEALFNATFSSPDEKYVDKNIQELLFDVNAHRDNKLSLKEVNELYEDIIRTVRDAYINDGFTQNKGLMSVIVNRSDYDIRGGQLKVTLISGRTTQDQVPDVQMIEYGPFGPNACWYYGEYGGSCDDPYLLTDAAELLEDTINYYHGCYKRSKPYVSRNIYVDMNFIQLNGNEYKFDDGSYYLFYKQNCDKEELYLTGAALNRYYKKIKQVIFDKVPNDPKYVSELPEEPTFMEINIDGIKTIDNSDVIYSHQFYILYGNKCEVSRSEMGSVIDLLTYNN